MTLFSRKPKIIYQEESNDCGYACVSMITSYLGSWIKPNELKRQFPNSGRGLTLLDLKNIFRETQINCEAYFLGDDKKRINCPAIAHWDWNHFIVVESIKNNKAVILDPRQGRIVIDISLFAEKCTGFVLEFPDNKIIHTRINDHSFSTIMSIFKGVKFGKTISLTFSLAITSQFFFLLLPIFSKWLLDEVIVVEDFDYLLIITLGFTLVILLTQVINYLRQMVDTIVSASLYKIISLKFISLLLDKDITFFENRKSVNLINKYRSLKAVQSFFLKQSVSFLSSIFSALFSIAILISIFPLMTLVIFVFLFFEFAIKTVINKKIVGYTSSNYAKNMEIETKLNDIFSSMQSIKLFDARSSIEAKYEEDVSGLYESTLKLERATAFDGFVTTLFESLERVLILSLGAYLIINNQLTIGILVSALMYKEIFVASLKKLQSMYFEYTRLSVYLTRLDDVYEDVGEASRYISTEETDIKGDIHIKDLYFKYGFNEDMLFKGLDISIASGKSVAIVGASGIGKTTLLKMLCGLLTPTSGSICIDGYDITDPRNSWVLRKVSSVMQEDRLINGSILDNICFFNDKISHNKALAAAKEANIHTEIEAFPMGYNTILGPENNNISSGQKQRILIARALAREPRILVMDEATSNMDIDNELQVAKSISKLKLTKIIVAHRPQTIQSCDIVINLEKLITKGNVNE